MKEYAVPDDADEIAGLGREVEQADNDKPLPTKMAGTREHSNVVSVKEATCTCGKSQAYKYPCQHAMAYFYKWEHIMFPDILKNHIH